jgi:hypothetical protein
MSKTGEEGAMYIAVTQRPRVHVPWSTVMAVLVAAVIAAAVLVLVNRTVTTPVAGPVVRATPAPAAGIAPQVEGVRQSRRLAAGARTDTPRTVHRRQSSQAAAYRQFRLYHRNASALTVQ